jgi:hypothetical protein
VKRIVLALALCLSAAPALAQNPVLNTLQAFRPGYPTPMAPTQLAELLNRVAWQHRGDGWGLLRKDGGNRCPAPQGVTISCDFLFNSVTRQGFDVLIASDTDAIPGWIGPYDLSGVMSLFVAPVGPPAPPPPPPPPPVLSFGDVPVPGDYDGDGQVEVAVYRTTTGEWLIAQSRDGGKVVPWGAPALGDVPMPADYDGDRRTDIAVFRPPTGEWFILLSSNGPIRVEFGAASASGLRDRPLAGDYDHDGKADLGIYRAATGEWFVLRSTDQGVSHFNWGAP